MRQTRAGEPCTLDQIAAALDAADCAEIERGAGLLDEARRSLRAIAGSFERALSRLEDCWQGAGARAGWPDGDATMSRLGEPLRRTRELLHHLDESEYGQQLRRTANALAAGQARVRELQAQRATSPASHHGYDERGQLVLHDVALVYRDIGGRLGGVSPPLLAPLDEPTVGAGLRRSARDEEETVLLASGPNIDVELFRPAGSALGAGLPGDATPPLGGGGGGGGMPMMPMPMGGMGAMGGMSGFGQQTENAAQQRRGPNAIQGDQDAWGKQDEGWDVLGRKQQIANAQEQVRQGLDREFGKFLKGDRDG